MSDGLTDVVAMAERGRPGFAAAIGYRKGNAPSPMLDLTGVPPVLGPVYAIVAGTPGGATDQRLMDLVPRYRLFHFAELHDVARIFRETWPEHRAMFPFLADYAGCYFLVDDSAVVAVDKELGSARVADGINRYWATVARCYREGTYFVGEDGYLDYDVDREAEIGAEMNPGCEFWHS